MAAGRLHGAKDQAVAVLRAKHHWGENGPTDPEKNCPQEDQLQTSSWVGKNILEPIQRFPQNCLWRF